MSSPHEVTPTIPPEGRLTLLDEWIEKVEGYETLSDVLEGCLGDAWEADRTWARSREVAADIVEASGEANTRYIDLIAAELPNSPGPGVPVAFKGNRQKERGRKKIHESMSRSLQFCILSARVTASQESPDPLVEQEKRYRREATEEVKETFAALTAADISEDTVKKVADTIVPIGTRVFRELGELYHSFYNSQDRVLKGTYTYIALHPETISDLIEWLQGSPEDESAGNSSILTILANDAVDRGGDNVFYGLFEGLRNGLLPLEVQDVFIESELRKMQLGEAHQNEGVNDLALLRAMFSGSDEEFVEKMVENSQLWGANLQSKYSTFRDEVIVSARDRLLKLLEPYVRRSRFQPADAGLTTNAQLRHHTANGSNANGNGGKKKRAKGGRVTPKRRSDVLKDAVTVSSNPEQSVTRFQGYRILRKTPDGIVADNADMSDVRKLLSDYAGTDARLLADVSTMLASICEQPYGDGATSYKNLGQIKIEGKKVVLMHLSPRHRSLKLHHQASPDTRISYVVLPADDGDGFQIAVHKIFHKNEVAGRHNPQYKLLG